MSWLTSPPSERHRVVGRDMRRPRSAEQYGERRHPAQRESPAAGAPRVLTPGRPPDAPVGEFPCYGTPVLSPRRSPTGIAVGGSHLPRALAGPAPDPVVLELPLAAQAPPGAGQVMHHAPSRIEVDHLAWSAVSRSPGMETGGASIIIVSRTAWGDSPGTAISATGSACYRDGAVPPRGLDRAPCWRLSPRPERELSGRRRPWGP